MQLPSMRSHDLSALKNCHDKIIARIIQQRENSCINYFFEKTQKTIAPHFIEQEAIIWEALVPAYYRKYTQLHD
jgi:predicted nucleic acid-binding OB-fold protein